MFLKGCVDPTVNKIPLKHKSITLKVSVVASVRQRTAPKVGVVCQEIFAMKYFCLDTIT